MSDNPLFSQTIRFDSRGGLYSSAIEGVGVLSSGNPHLSKLPEWPNETIAVLCTDGGPHAIPITAPLRVADRRILFALEHHRGSLERLHSHPRVAFLILGEGDLAFTARGKASIVQEQMRRAPGFAAVLIDVEVIDDHRLKGRAITSGPGLDWSSSSTKSMLGEHIGALREIAATIAHM